MRKGIICCLLCMLFLAACKTEEAVDKASIIETLNASIVSDYSLYKDLVTLPSNYVGIEVPKVTEEESQEYIKGILSEYNEFEVVDREAVKGDTVNIDYVGYVDGVEISGYSAQGVNLELGAEIFIAGFDEQLLGTKAGDVVNVRVTYPEDYFITEMCGTTVDFKVTVNSVQITIEKELTVDFVKEYTDGDLETIETFLTYIDEYLQDVKKAETVFKYLDENSNIESVNMTCVENDVSSAKTYCEMYAANYNITTDEFVQLFYGNSTLDEYLNTLRENLTLYEQRRAVLYTIAVSEELTVSEEDLNAQAVKYGFDTVEELYAEYGEQFIHQTLLMEAAIEFLVDNTIIVTSY